ncbi:maleylacetate reductase [Dactylosporangium sp. AC04546]|uniref:maleylacetate reductase n=1 Tax=Dactylosporangium sp. AC04546 TaxID=2862460 RepID=UPI001EDEF3DD|nr:maleylacetate reductase [Dactylosporangium sp. AC04546]WVK79158.1 maleylacetate reductase [Dactylosporangium sp. AC04546]
MTSFVHEPLPVRVVFGPGSAVGLQAELDRLDLRRPVLISTPGQAAAARSLAAAFAGHLPTAVMHVPAAVAGDAAGAVRDLAADGLVAYGGGSATGLAEAVARDTGLPIVAVPTTYAGSEMTPIWGVTDGGVKRTGRDPRVLPRTVLYDPDLTAALPAQVAAASGLNALAHAVEALYAPDRSPVVTLLAEAAIGALGRALPRLVTAPDAASRTEALYGAWLCGTCLGSTTMGLHHKLCHVLGGTFGLPHAGVHAVILPYALAYNATHAPGADAAVARALGQEGGQEGGHHDGAAALHHLARAVGAPRSLADLGLRAEDLDEAATLAGRDAYPNPRPITAAGLRELLRQAYEGRPPGRP